MIIFIVQGVSKYMSLFRMFIIPIYATELILVLQSIVAYRIKFYLVYYFNILHVCELVPCYLSLQTNSRLCNLSEKTSFCSSANTGFTKIGVVFGISFEYALQFSVLFLYISIPYKVKLIGTLLTLVTADFVLHIK